MRFIVLLVAALCQASLTALLYYARGRSRLEVLHDDLVVFLLPGLIGCALFWRGFSTVFSEAGDGYDRPMTLLAAVAAAFAVMLAAIAMCVRYLGS